MKKLISALVLLAFVNVLSAQGMDTMMRSNQKFYVVVAVLLIILVGIIAFLFSIEKRLKKLEHNH